jgi:hypothetical protein
MEYRYYIGEGQEADALLTEVRQRSETAYAARTKLMEDYGADALILSWEGKPVCLGFKQEQRIPYLKGGGRRYDGGFAYYPKMSTKAGKELSAKLDAPELEFSASGYILKLLKLSRMVVGRHSGPRTGIAMYRSTAGYCGDKLLVKIPDGNDPDGDPMPEIPSWMREVKESEWLAAQGK